MNKRSYEGKQCNYYGKEAGRVWKGVMSWKSEQRLQEGSGIHTRSWETKANRGLLVWLMKKKYHF